MKNILIIDDEKNIRMTIKNCLKHDDYEVDIAINGEEGFEKIQAKKYDLVLLDISMPGISGIELLRMVRDKEINTPIIIMTAYGTVEKAVEAMKLGAIDFLSKPFTPSEIRYIVKKVTERDGLEEENLESFEDVLEYSKVCILKKDYDKAKSFLEKAISLDMNAPEPHNIIGVLYEMESDLKLAQKHYRVALALDPTYKPASKNLDRVTEYRYTSKGIDMGN